MLLLRVELNNMTADSNLIKVLMISSATGEVVAKPARVLILIWSPPCAAAMIGQTAGVGMLPQVAFRRVFY